MKSSTLGLVSGGINVCLYFALSCVKFPGMLDEIRRQGMDGEVLEFGLYLSMLAVTWTLVVGIDKKRRDLFTPWLAGTAVGIIVSTIYAFVTVQIQYGDSVIIYIYLIVMAFESFAWYIVFTLYKDYRQIPPVYFPEQNVDFPSNAVNSTQVNLNQMTPNAIYPAQLNFEQEHQKIQPVYFPEQNVYLPSNTVNSTQVNLNQMTPNALYPTQLNFEQEPQK